MAAGLQDAVSQVRAMGRGPDTMLAHISPDEARFIDHIQGGQRTNPHTGLPEYGMFGNILKAVARAGAAVGGFMLAGPAGAAAASGAATKLTGGSWKEALGSAALSGVGSLGAQGLTGGGWNPLGAGGSSAYVNAAGTAVPASSAMNMQSFLQTAKSVPGIAAGMGALSQPLDHPSVPAMPSAGGGNSIHLNDVVAQPRTFQPYQGDPLHFAEPGSGGEGHVFYDPMNPVPKYAMAGGGAVMGLTGPDLGARGMRGGGADMPAMPGANYGLHAPGIGIHTPQLQQAAMLGYQTAAKGGEIYAAPRGAVHGPGGPEEDKVPAMLSAGEHIVDAKTVDLAGGGSNERGQKVLEQIKQDIRQGHVKDPKKPPAFQKGATRAKRRAGMK